MSKEAMKLETIMEQAQVFASAWSLVGSRFDNGNMLNEAEAAKNELREMVYEALAEQPAQQEPDINYCPTCAALSKDFEDTDLSTQPAPVQRSPVAFVRDDGTWDGTVLELVWDKKDDGFIYKPLYTSPPQRTWEPMETAPKDGTEILLMYMHIDTQVVHNGFWIGVSDTDDESDIGWWSYDHSELSRIKLDDWMTPTHWLPLPVQF